MLRFMESFDHCGPIIATTTEIAQRLATKWDVIDQHIDETYYGDKKSFWLEVGYKSQGYCLCFSNSQSNFLVKLLDNQDTWSVGFAFKTPAAGTVTPELVCALYSKETPVVSITYTDSISGGRLFVKKTTGTTIISMSTYLTESTWYYVEFKTYVHPTAGTCEFRIDGSVIGTASSVAFTGLTDADKLIVTNVGNCCFDDIYVLDGQTGLDDFLGPSKVSVVYPISDGGPNDWSPVGDHYTLVDDPTLTMSDNVYTNANGSEIFNFDDAPGSGSLYGVQLVAQLAVAGSQINTAKLICQSGVNEASVEQSIMQQDNHTDIIMPVDIDPNTGAAWTRSNLNAAKFGVERVG